MWKPCSMKTLSRRATSGTQLESRVPKRHVFMIKRAKNNEIWHTLAKNHEKHACQMWHTFNFAAAVLGKGGLFCKAMIKNQFQWRKPPCEMCDTSIQDNHKTKCKRSMKRSYFLKEFINRFLTKESNFSSEILVKTNLNI